MDTVTKAFERMGARVKVREMAPPPSGRGFRPDLVERFVRQQAPVRINITKDAKGEAFDISFRKGVTLSVIDVRPQDRHLLLLTTDQRASHEKAKFLCGHDERSWFVAAIPEAARAKDVPEAKEALKPPEVLAEQDRRGVKVKHRSRRHTKAYVRQGEWFFVPQKGMSVKPGQILRCEPIRRGAGKPHMCEELYREGGVQVYVNADNPNGITSAEWNALPQAKRRNGWRAMMRDARAFVRGAISHPDHATIILREWHLVVMNTETKSRAMEHVAFLD